MENGLRFSEEQRRQVLLKDSVRYAWGPGFKMKSFLLII